MQDRVNLLKEACEEALKKDPEIYERLEGKKIEFSYGSGYKWQKEVISKLKNVHDDYFNIYIVQHSEYDENQFFIFMPTFLGWIISGKYFHDSIRGKFKDNVYVALDKISNIIFVTVTF